MVFRYKKAIAFFCLFFVVLPFNQTVKAADRKDQSQIITITGVIVGGICTFGFFKYMRDVFMHWGDRKFVGECERTFLAAQKRYVRIASSYHDRGMDGLRDFILSRDQDALKVFDRIKCEVKATVDKIAGQIRQLDSLESKLSSNEEREKVAAQIRRGSELLVKFQGFFDLLRQQKEPFFLEMLMSLPLPSLDVQNPFQTIEYVQKIDQRIAQLKRYSGRLYARSNIQQGEALMLEKAQSVINHLENIIRNTVVSKDYKQELRLKKDTDLAKEHLAIERKQLALKEEKVAVKKRLAREIEVKNRLERLRQQENREEERRLERQRREIEAANRELDEKLRSRGAYIESLQYKIRALEQEREGLKKRLQGVRENSVENNRIQKTKEMTAQLNEKCLIRLEQRLQELEKKIARLKHLVNVPPMNPQHPDYLKLLQKQIRDL